MKIVISESELSCPDGFSPNNDQKNDEFKIKHKSIVKLQGYVVNRWGKKLHEFTLQNVDDGWDGRYGGDYVPDGAYLLYIDALGSDGVHYKIRKAINVLKGKNEGEGTTTGTP
jgi:gliding motility-associated-like protein